MVKEKKFKFELKQEVEIACSGETGTVTCRMDGIDCKDQFKVRYKAGDGRAQESWWDQSALKAKPIEKKAAPVKKAPAKKAPAKKKPEAAPAAPAKKKTRSKKAAKKA